MILNIMAYRANGEDSRMGCCVGSSDSNISFFNTQNIEEAAEFIAKIKFDDIFTDPEYCSHKFIVIADGRVISNDIDNEWYIDDEVDKYRTITNDLNKLVNGLISKHTNAKVIAEEIAKEEAEEIKRMTNVEKAKAHEQYILEEYNKLNRT